MKQKSLILFGLVAALVSSALLFYVSLQIERSRSEISWTNTAHGVGMFNYTNQNGHNLFRLIESLNDYQAANSTEEKEKQKKSYIKNFDILWAGLVSLKQMDKYDHANEVFELKTHSRDLLMRLDPLIKPQVELSDSQISSTVLELRDLYRLNTSTSNKHFTRYSKSNDLVNNGIARLQRLSRLLIVGFCLSLGSSFFLLWRTMNRERKQAQELKIAHQQLTVLVDDLRSGQEEKRARNQFLAAASHDLRQPLHALGLFLNSLERSVKDDEGHRILEKVRSSTGALNGLFNSLLDISRLDAGVVNINPSHVSLDKLFAELQAEFSELANQQDVRLNIGLSDQVVFTDRILLQRILRNLIENCLLHAPGSTISLDATPAQASQLNNQISKPESPERHTVRQIRESQHQVCQIVVSDNGPGIPVSQHELVFSEYYQLSNPERDRNKGLGLGLSIVKRLVDLLEHNLTLSSKVGEGTVFTLELPFGDASLLMENFQMKHDASATLEGLTVLVIDDEADILTGMEAILGNAGCVVLTGESAEKARELLVQTNLVPDIIIADYRLRDNRTGSEAVELIREELNNDIPAFLITGDTSSFRVFEATESGIRVLHKPVLPNDLFTAIREVTSQSEQPAPLEASLS